MIGSFQNGDNVGVVGVVSTILSYFCFQWPHHSKLWWWIIDIVNYNKKNEWKEPSILWYRDKYRNNIGEIGWASYISGC